MKSRGYRIEDDEYSRFEKKCKKVERKPSQQVRLLIKKFLQSETVH